MARFKLMSTRSGNLIDPKLDIPQIEVTFANGIKQKMILQHYNAIPNSKMMDQSRLCNYLGHLDGDERESRVAVTGCLLGDNPDEKMYITLLSKHSPNHKTFSLETNGNVQHIEIRSDEEFVGHFTPKNIERTSDGWHDIGGDASVNDNEAAAAANVTSQQMETVPTTLK